MSRYRGSLPQLSGDLFLADAGLDECEVLDDGNPQELGEQYRNILAKMPWLNIFGGCCGSDLRHVTQIVKAIDWRGKK